MYDRTSPCLYGVALRVLGDVCSAQQSTEEVYLQVWRSAGRFDPADGSPLARLTTLAHRHAVDRARSEQPPMARAVRCDIASRTDDFEQIVNEQQRESITLAYYGGLTYREVAEQLGVEVPTITSRIRAGLTQLGQ